MIRKIIDKMLEISLGRTKFGKALKKLGEEGLILDELEKMHAEGEIEKRVRPDGEIEWGPLTEKGEAQWKKQIAEGLIERQVCDNGEAVWSLTEKGIALSKKGKL